MLIMPTTIWLYDPPTYEFQMKKPSPPPEAPPMDPTLPPPEIISAATTTFQVGLNNVSSDQIKVTFGGVQLTAITANSTDLATATHALNALATIDTAIQNVSTARSNFGTAMNRMDFATSNIQTMQLNITAANSRIRDVDSIAVAVVVEMPDRGRPASRPRRAARR